MNKLIILSFVVIYCNNGFSQNVGIGTTTPTRKLTVVANNYGIAHTNGVDTIATWIGPQGNQYGFTGTITNAPYRLGSGNNRNHLTLADNGFVGIGDTLPGYKLTVVKDNFGIVQTNTDHTASVGFWVNKAPAFVYGWSGTITPHPYSIGSGLENNHITILNNGNVGIGKKAQNPMAAFNVADSSTVLFGKDTLGGGTKMMWLPQKNAFRGGRLDDAGGYDPLDGLPSSYWNTDSVGYNSFAFGINVKAKAHYATAIGYFSIATGVASTALGYSKALGYTSTALGNSKASGDGSTAMGSSNAVGAYSTAMGFSSNAKGDFSTAIGHTYAKANYSTSMGAFNDTIASSSPNTWISTDPLVTVGNGSGPSNLSNALTIFKNGNHKIQGYTQLGDDAPKIKTKKLTGITTTQDNTFLFLATGIADPNKILGIQVMVQSGSYYFLPHSTEKGYIYTVNTDPNGGPGQSIAIGVKDFQNSNAVMGKVVKVLVTYEE